MTEQLSKVYDSKTVERQVNELWQSKSYFHAEPSRHAVAGRKAGVLGRDDCGHHAGAHDLAQADVADIAVARVEPNPHRGVHRYA